MEVTQEAAAIVAALAEVDATEPAPVDCHPPSNSNDVAEELEEAVRSSITESSGIQSPGPLPVRDVDGWLLSSTAINVLLFHHHPHANIQTQTSVMQTPRRTPPIKQ